jgi:two-component system OmpR family response regulator
MIEILLVEDDPVLGRGLNVNLELEGYKVQWARDLKTAAEMHAASKLNLIVLDLNLPDGNGISFLKTIRAAGSKVPVVILTAVTDEDSVVEGLQSGANDYVRKPFGNKELLARVKIALRETAGNRGQEVRYGELFVLVDERRIKYGDADIDLNRREFEVLSYFISHAEAVVTREALLSTLDKDGEIFDRTIDSHVSHVRTRLKQAGVTAIQISSVYGLGYRLEQK